MPKDGSFDFEAAEKVFFASQTIQNACGTQALLSVLLNKDGRIDIGAQLSEFKDFTGAFPSEVCLLPPTRWSSYFGYHALKEMNSWGWVS